WSTQPGVPPVGRFRYHDGRPPVPPPRTAMTDRDALLAAIIARPEDDLPRLVFADWLEEHGESARATFIRAQIAGDDAAAADFLREHKADWDRELPEWATWQDTKVVYRRGFVAELVTTTRRLLRDGHELFAVAPVHAVRLRPQVHFSDSTPELFEDRPYYSRITSLRLGPRLLNIAPLRGANRDPLDIYFLAVAQNLNALRVLDVSENNLTDDWATRFAHRFRLMAFRRALAEMDLSDNEITDTGADVLCLVLQGVRLRLRGNRITSAAAERLRRRFGERVEV
ncbi:MAG TPA: TIGR02996 domain-containing protein, partial [Fimbriiglobus sp.]|nr:TIGR02996 domain-containing protein [Fimbriiglobus sp.]